MKCAYLVSLFLLSLPALAAEGTGSVQAAASRIVEGIDWQEKSVLTGDFTCRGKQERAILGTSKTEIVVAVFTDGLSKAPKVLRYSAEARDPSLALLKTESMAFDPKEMLEQVGYLPPGIRPSKTCLGLVMTDERIDSAHIYWNHDAREFADWSL